MERISRIIGPNDLTYDQLLEIRNIFDQHNLNYYGKKEYNNDWDEKTLFVCLNSAKARYPHPTLDIDGRLFLQGSRPSPERYNEHEICVDYNTFKLLIIKYIKQHNL